MNKVAQWINFVGYFFAFNRLTCADKYNCIPNVVCEWYKNTRQWRLLILNIDW